MDGAKDTTQSQFGCNYFMSPAGLLTPEIKGRTFMCHDSPFPVMVPTPKVMAKVNLKLIINPLLHGAEEKKLLWFPVCEELRTRGDSPVLTFPPLVPL